MSVTPFSRTNASQLTEWLKQVGILHEDNSDMATRIIIDIKIGDVAKVYIERLADRSLLDARPLPTGYEIIHTVVEKAP